MHSPQMVPIDHSDFQLHFVRIPGSGLAIANEFLVDLVYLIVTAAYRQTQHHRGHQGLSSKHRLALSVAFGGGHPPSSRANPGNYPPRARFPAIGGAVVFSSSLVERKLGNIQ